MSESQHSPTPWRTGGKNGNFIDSAIGSGKLQEVAHCEFEAGPANARHIVKCVNAHERLVEALKNVLEAQKHHDRYFRAEAMAKAGNSARDLLAEIKGDERWRLILSG